MEGLIEALFELLSGVLSDVFATKKQKFRRKLRRLEKELTRTTGYELPEAKPGTETALAAPFDDLLKRAEVTPAPAIVATWDHLRSEVCRLAAAHGVDHGDPKPASTIASDLIKKDIMPSKSDYRLNDLAILRDRIADDQPDWLTADDARRYIIAAETWMAWVTAHKSSTPAP